MWNKHPFTIYMVWKEVYMVWADRAWEMFTLRSQGHGTWCLVPSNYPFKDCAWKKAPGYCTMDTIAPWKPWLVHTGLSIQSALKHYTDTPGVGHWYTWGSTLIHLGHYTDTPGAVHWYTWGSTLIHLGQYTKCSTCTCPAVIMAMLDYFTWKTLMHYGVSRGITVWVEALWCE